MSAPTPSTPAASQPMRAPRGTEISCKGWQQEAALRMLLNSLDPEIAESPQKLVVRAETAEIAPERDTFHSIAASLQAIDSDETLLVRSGRASSVECTQKNAPCVVIVNSFPGAPHSPRAGVNSWTYLGAQEALHAAYEMFALAAREYFQADLSGKLVLSPAMGNESGARSLAGTMNGAAFLGIDADPERIKRRVKTGYCDVLVNDLDEALRILKNAVRTREATSVGLAANSAAVIPQMARRGIVPDLLAGSFNSDDLVGGYVPQGMDVEQAAALRETDPESYRRRALDSIAQQLEGMLTLEKLGSLRIGPLSNRIASLPAIPAIGPLRLVALSGEVSDLHRLGRLILEKFPDDEILCRWFFLAHKRTRLQGLPSRICTLPSGEHARFCVAINDLVASGELQAPVVIGADFESDDAFDAGCPGGILIAAANGASWLSVDTRSAGIAGDATPRSTGIGRVLVADGTAEMAARIERVFAAGNGKPAPPKGLSR